MPTLATPAVTAARRHDPCAHLLAEMKTQRPYPTGATLPGAAQQLAAHMRRRSEACIGGLAGNESDAFIERKVTRMRNDSHLLVSSGNGASRRILDERSAHSLAHEVRVNEEIV